MAHQAAVPLEVAVGSGEPVEVSTHVHGGFPQPEPPGNEGIGLTGSVVGHHGPHLVQAEVPHPDGKLPAVVLEQLLRALERPVQLGRHALEGAREESTHQRPPPIRRVGLSVTFHPRTRAVSVRILPVPRSCRKTSRRSRDSPGKRGK